MSTMRRAFTLVELLVVIAIISVLAALLLPTLADSLSLARTTVCANNQRQLHLAMTMYAESWDGIIGKKDYGRAGGGGYAQYLNRIVQSNYTVGDPRIMIDHGPWLAGGMATPDLYFCPDATWEQSWGASYAEPMRIHHRAYTGYMRQLLETGGMQWSAKTTTNSGGTAGVNLVWLYTQVSYAFNRLLVPGVTWGTFASINPMIRTDGAGYRLHAARPEFPLLADSRSYAYSSSYHAGRGWNVCHLDGAVAFRTTSRTAETGLAHNVSTRYAYWAGVERAPDDPRLDPDVVALGNRPVMHTGSGMDERFGRLWITLYYMRK